MIGRILAIRIRMRKTIPNVSWSTTPTTLQQVPMRGHMREHSMTGISRTFPRTITLMTVTRPTRRRRTAGGAGMSALITAEKICFSSTATRTASAWRCVCRPGIIMKKHLRTLRHWCGRSCGRRGFRWKESIVIMTSAANTVRARS